ncbi:LacI family transcriptional regulator [Clostridium algidicarnis]|uniref:LacI family DNA-binding transcriptional regulator n=1 Tax=Clostridium algidicarnis TaxID=37659 RepID=UPI001C0C1202|nr:LacI family DNA-binding transcriptional regulator [Clostridium algidicarnis]MBU3208978.1 LacI family transcriptional regulator [Clostridium algidicarnis]
MANIRDIARESGLSIGTISRYINSTGYVSEESAKKIQTVINAMNYTPNQHARALFNSKSKIIGLVFPSLINPYFSELATSFEHLLQEKGYVIILCNTEDSREKELQALELLKGFRVEGIILGRSQCKNELNKINIPMISYESTVENNNIITVSADNYKGGSQAFEHLYEKGCRKLLHIKGPTSFEATQLRYEGFIDSANKKGIKPEIINFDIDFDLENKNYIDSVLDNYDMKKYDGIFVFNDIVAAQMLRYLNERHIRVPEDIKLLGFDNSYICDLLSPRLSTIEQPIISIAERCIELLFEIIDGKKVYEKEHLITTRIIQRETT